jgi:tetratricopeptide (TPR) repeat protein
MSDGKLTTSVWFARRARRGRAWAAVLAAVLLSVGCGGPAAAAAVQEEAAEEDFVDARPLYLQRPFDQLTIKRNGRKVRIVPLDLPVRKVVMQRSGVLRVRLMRDPSEDYLINWVDIEKIDLYEELVLAEANQTAANGQMDEAFRYFAFLVDRYPKLDNLESSLQSFLFNSAAQLAREQRFAEALSSLEELHGRNGNYVGPGERTVTSAMSTVAAALLQKYLAEENYVYARQLATRLNERYGESRLPSLADARTVMIERAQQKAAEVRQLLAANKPLEAQAASRQMLRIWPALEGGLDLAREASSSYPILAVGVAQRAHRLDVAAMDDWAARRAGRLTDRLLVEYVGPGPEGGRYASVLGSVERTDDYLQVVFRLRRSGDSGAAQATAYDVADRLLALADPRNSSYVPGWAELVQSVHAEGGLRVEVDLRRSHVIPESFLRVPFGGEDDASPWLENLRPYHFQGRTDDDSTAVFKLNPDFAGKGPQQPAEVRERYFEDTSQAMEALERGDILALDRVFPADAGRLLAQEKPGSVLVRPYSAPTLHLLVPNLKSPYIKNATFRRALLHGIPRELILERLLDGRTIGGCRIISGPFPAGYGANDPMSYAYDESLPARTFDPGVAMLLASMAANQLATQAEKDMEPPPVLEPLILAHPEDKAARFACAIIAEQWKALQIPCVLKQLPAGQTSDPSGQYDLLYASVTVYEPAVDAQRILGSDGLARSNSPYIGLALRRVQQATTWREARQRLLELHQLAHAEVTMLPLWQIIEHYAVSRNLRGVSPNAVTLYQDIERWQIEPVISLD